MPSGVYERKPWMKSYGWRVDRKQLLALKGRVSIREAARKACVSHTTVWRIWHGYGWNDERERRPM